MKQKIHQTQKALLRQTIRTRAAELSSQERKQSDTDLFRAFLQRPELAVSKTVLLFYGVGIEPDTESLISSLLKQGKQVCLPRCLPKHQMEACLIRTLHDIQPGLYGIPEPKKTCPIIEPDCLDLILVPAICCDRKGFRLGQGGGYYDRYLPRTRAQTVCLCRDVLLQDAVPREAHDQTMDLIVTETQQVVPLCQTASAV